MSGEFPVDVLSDAFDQIEVEQMMTGGFAVRGPWASRGEVTRPFKLIALVAGTARVSVRGSDGPQGPIDLLPGDVVLLPGDVVLLNHRTFLEVRGGVGADGLQELIPEASFDAMSLDAADLAHDDVLVGGWIRVSAAGTELLRTALPGLVHVHAASESSPRLASLVRVLFEEASRPRPGSGFAVRQNGQLLLLELVRAHLEREPTSSGWLRLLADEQLAPALRSMHAEPGRSWGLAELATAAGMSRTSFAQRFRTVAGIPPLAYLASWRMVLAQRLLRDPDVRVGAVALQLGYRSESAFSNAFKRETGEAPLHYRHRVRLGAE